jgi:hypothetical protein
MISIKVSYEQVLKDYPEVVEEFLSSLKESNSSSRDIQLEKIKWFYTWGKFGTKAKTEEEKVLKSITLQKLGSMTYDERLPIEIEKIKVSVTMEAGHFLKGDRVPKESVVSPLVIRYENELLKNQMLNEQKDHENAHVINSIPEIDKDILDELIPPEVKAMQEKMQQAIENGQLGQQAPSGRAKTPSFEIDDLLDKISDEGLESLSDEEKEFLKNQSDKN